MIGKLLRGIINFFRIAVLHVRLASRFEMPLIQPMRVNSQLLIKKKVLKVKIGKNFRLETNAKIRVIDGGLLEVGNNCFINCNSYVTVMGTTVIGDNCLIGPGVMIFDHDHDFRAEGGIKAGKNVIGKILIGNDVWIGANCIILKGTTIGDGSVIAAGSVIHGEVPPNSLVIQRRNSEYIKL